MKTYRLKQWYPGLNDTTEVGEEVITIYQHAWIKLKDGQNLHTNHLKYAEFWEEVEELDYQILSFVSTSKHSNKQTSKLLSNGKHKWLSDTHPVEMEEEDLLNGKYAIHSVKRLSDGAVFNVGDGKIKVPETTHNFYNKDDYRIFSFYIVGNEISAKVENGCHIKLQDLSFIEKPIFTYTEEEMMKVVEHWGFCQVDIQYVNQFLSKK